MKKFMTVYIIFSIIFLVMIYFFTLVQETNKRTLAVFFELADDVVETGDFEPFIKYQSIAFDKVDEIYTQYYGFHVYHNIAMRNDLYINQFSVFVIPIDVVLHATELGDQEDQTGVIVTNKTTDTLIYSTESDSDYDEYAVSYGIEKIGFYYYAPEITETVEIEIELLDYQGTSIFNQTYTVTYQEFDPENLGSFTLGYSQDEIEDLMDLASYTQPALIQNITLFIVIDIFAGAALHFFLKKKKLQASFYFDLFSCL